MFIKKTIGKIHLWLGLGSGLVVCILGLTGCMYVFIDELKPLVYANRMYVAVPTHAQRLSLDLLKENAQNALGPAYPLVGAEIPMEVNRTVSFRAVQVDREAFPYANYIKHYYRVYVNPYTGQVVKVENTKWEFFNVVVNLHVNLLLGHKVGGQIVAWSVVMFVVLLLSGLILWWPKNKSAAKQRFWFKWKEGLKWKRKNYDLHNILGFYAMFVLLVIALTGLVWSFEWFNNSVQWLANGGKTYERPQTFVSDTSHQGTFSLTSIVNKVLWKSPEAGILYISIPSDVKSPVYVYAQMADANYKSTRFEYDQHTEALLAFKSFKTMNNGEKINVMNYDLHVGSIVGLRGKILAFCASLIAASLPITGFLIWRGRKKKTQKENMKPHKLFKLKRFDPAI